MKKLISIVLCVLMLMSIAAPMMAFATEVKTKTTPVIFIRGASRTVYASDESDDDSTAIYPFDVDFGQILSDFAKPGLETLASGLVTGDYDAYCDELYNTVAPLFEKVILDKNGEASDGSGDGTSVEKFKCPYQTSNFGLWDYDFSYDMRLSPLDIVDDLVTYIERVKRATGAEKVSLVGRCFGGNLISTYLAKYGEHALANVESVVMYIPSTQGIDLIGALFAGEIKLDSDDVDRFVEYVMNDMGLIEDEMLQSLIVALVDLLNYAKVLGLGTDALQLIVDNVKDNLVPRLALASYGTFPSYWAMVPAEYYIKARDNVFAGVEDEYAGMISKLDAYYYDVQLTYESVMNDLTEKGLKIAVLSKYDVPLVPVYEGANSQGDFLAETADISFGATCANMGEVLSDSYIESLTDKRFVSPDKKVDASTCLYPEKTWFLKGIFHTTFPDCVNYLIGEIVDSKGELTVFDNEKYPQYLVYDAEAGTISPVTSLDPEKPAEGTNEERFSILIRFFTAIFNFFSKLISGEFSFSDIF